MTWENIYFPFQYVIFSFLRKLYNFIFNLLLSLYLSILPLILSIWVTNLLFFLFNLCGLFNLLSIEINVLKPDWPDGSIRDPSMEPGRVVEKTGQGFGPAKLDQPG
jgi:hypothetical protein